MLNKLSKIGHRPDYFLMALIFILTIFGLAMLASASSEMGKMKFNDSYYYLKHQIYYGLSLGIVGFILGYIIYYQRFRKLALLLLMLSLVALFLVFTRFGVEVRNANRWVQLGPITFQPAEILKLTFVLYLAAWLSNPKTRRGSDLVSGLIPFLLISAFIAILLFRQPATSTVVILLSAGLVVYFLSGAKKRYIFLVSLLVLVGLAVIIYATPYRWQRILSYINPQHDVEGQNYHINQALIAIGSGGVRGAGYGQSAAKIKNLPAPIDDSIFAVVAEELGFVGAGALVVLFGILTFRLFWLAKNIRNSFGRLILIGFGTIIAFQSLVNMSAISGIIPLTGVPLPFISYGGTALAVFLTMAGIATNISKYT